MVTLTGTGFASGAAVTFGGVAATVTSTSATSLEVETPPHAAGPVDIVITNPDGESAELPGVYTYGSGSMAVPLSEWEREGVTFGSPTTFAGRMAQKVTETRTSGYHYFQHADGSRGFGTWELTMVVHADVAWNVYLQMDSDGAPWPQARFNLSTGTVHSVDGDSTTASASMDDLGNGWYRCRLNVSGIRPHNMLVSMLNDSWATTYSGNGSRGLYVAEVTIDRR
jgi:hypothetical protein